MSVPRLVIVVFGPPASGKSTVARLIAQGQVECRLCGTDAFRKESGLPYVGISATETAYRGMSAVARRYLDEGYIPIMDATFYRKKYRQMVRQVLGQVVEHWLLIEVRVPLQLCRERIDRRSLAQTPWEGVDDIERFNSIVAHTEACDADEIPVASSRVIISGAGDRPQLIAAPVGAPSPWDRILTSLFGSYRGCENDSGT